MKLTLTNIDYLIRAEQIRKHKEVKDFQWYYATLRKLWFGKKIVIQQSRNVEGHFLYKIVNSTIFSCDQAALWMVFSVCLSVCPSLRPSHLFDYVHHRIIMKFSGVITTDQGNVHAKDQGQRSKVKVTEVTTQLSRFRTVTPVWIHQWLRNDTQSLK